MKLGEYVSKFSYPGRGVALGRSADGKKALMVYFIMGRSENSRNRMFVPEERAVRTKAVDESRMTDPSLIIYYPVRTVGKWTVVTNGDQTDTICQYIENGGCFRDALLTRSSVSYTHLDVYKRQPSWRGCSCRSARRCSASRSCSSAIR